MRSTTGRDPGSRVARARRAGPHRVRLMLAVGATAALALTACSSGHSAGGSSGGGGTSDQATVQNWSMGTADDSKGPAPAISGAKAGGTAYDLEQNGFDYLDPGQVYVNVFQQVAMLYNRSLTNYKILPNGKVILVGDLATDTGKSSDGGKTWTWTLKSGLKFQDGTPITSADVKYGIERLYAPFETQGPTYFQSWLSGDNFHKVYPGPYGGKSLPDSVISTPDSKTIVFHFQKAHPDAPFAASMANVGAIEKSKDTKTAYNNNPNSDGPYQVQSYSPGKSLVLVKNPNWDASTDPVRHQYPDKWIFQLGLQSQPLTARLMAEQGNDKDALTMSTPPDASQVPQLMSAQYASRRVSTYQPFVEVMDINTTRITNVDVRKAIAYALPVGQIQQLYGGSSQLAAGSTLISPTIKDWQKFDPFGKTGKPMGDPAMAKQLLAQAGQPHPHINYAYGNTPRNQKISVAVANALKAAGFSVTTTPLDPTSYYTLIGHPNNQFDLYRSGWGADWPVASTVIPPTLDGRTIGEGSPNYSHYNSSATNAEIDRINAETNEDQAAKDWVKLSEQILQNDVPQVPYGYDVLTQIYGSGLGGVRADQVLGTFDLTSVYVK